MTREGVCENIKLITDLSQIKKKEYSLYDAPNSINKKINSGLGIQFCVFAGGGISGLSYIGVLETFEKENLLPDIQYFIGSSSGALIAALAVFGVSSAQIKELLMGVDLGSMFRICGNRYDPNSLASMIVNAYYGIPELIKELGIISSCTFISWLEECMEEFGVDPNITLLQLYNKTGKMLVITATCLNTYSCLYLSAATYPNMRVIDALNASIQIPFVLQPIKFDDPSLEVGERTLCDGGVIDNLPLNSCDVIAPDGEIVGYNRRAIGFMPVSRGAWYPDYNSVDSILDYGMAVIRVLHSTIHMSRSNQEHYWDRITPIECGDASAFEFNVSTERAIALIESGKRAAEGMIKRRKEMIARRGPLPENLFIPNLRLRCCGTQIADSMLKETLIYKRRVRENAVPSQ
jgi:predicted acylesterase/phospholipase RssA